MKYVKIQKQAPHITGLKVSACLGNYLNDLVFVVCDCIAFDFILCLVV